MDLVALTETIVKSLVKDPDTVSVKQFDTDEDYILIQVMVDEDVLGSLIGKEGRIASAIRTIVKASSYLNNHKNVKINIDKF